MYVLLYIYFSAYNGYALENVCIGNGIPNDESHDYEKLVVKPIRPAPAVPASQTSFNSSCQGTSKCKVISTFLLRHTLTPCFLF